MSLVKDVISQLDSLNLVRVTLFIRWNRFILIKINIFLWRLVFNRLPTKSNLDRRMIELDSLICSWSVVLQGNFGKNSRVGSIWVFEAFNPFWTCCSGLIAKYLLGFLVWLWTLLVLFWFGCYWCNEMSMCLEMWSTIRSFCSILMFDFLLTRFVIGTVMLIKTWLSGWEILSWTNSSC